MDLRLAVIANSIDMASTDYGEPPLPHDPAEDGLFSQLLREPTGRVPVFGFHLDHSSLSSPRLKILLISASKRCTWPPFQTL